MLPKGKKLESFFLNLQIFVEKIAAILFVFLKSCSNTKQVLSTYTFFEYL